MSDDLVRRVAQHVCCEYPCQHPFGCFAHNCYVQARAAIAVCMEEAADAVGEVGDHAEVGAYINAVRALEGRT